MTAIGDPSLNPLTQVRVAGDRLLAGVVGLLGYAPAGADLPVQPLLPLRTLLADAFAALRRATDIDPANKTPTTHAVQLYQFVTGEVLGDLLPSDADGDALTYHLVQGPTNGTLTINANGTYYYKPTSDFAETGGIDSFVVTVDDGHQGQTVVPVDVRVAPTLGLSRNFYFRNYTLAPLKFTGYSGTTGDLDSGPAIGTVIMPGQQYEWDVTYYFFDSGSVSPLFSTVGFGSSASDPGYVPAGVGGNYHAQFYTAPGNGSRRVWCSSGGAACDTEGAHTVTGKDNPGTAVILSGADAAKMASVLPGICADGSDASCKYDATSQVAGFTPVRTIGTPVTNTTSSPTTYTIGIQDQVQQTDTVGVSVKLSGGQLAKLASLINIEITANYGHSWTSSHTFTQTVTVPVAAGYTSWIEGSAPVWRVTGDFTVTLGNSTYYLNGATFDTPNPSGVGSYVIRTKPIGTVGDGTVVATLASPATD
jgi:hypothetical protein